MTLDFPELAPGPFRDFLQQRPGLSLGLAAGAILVLGLLLGMWILSGRKRQIERLKAANQALEAEKQRLLERLATPQPPTARSLPLIKQGPRPAAFSQAETAPKLPPSEKAKIKSGDEVPADPPTVRMPVPMAPARSPAPEIARPPVAKTAPPATRVLRPTPSVAPSPAKPASLLPAEAPPSGAAAASPAVPASAAQPNQTSPVPQQRVFPPAPPAPDLAPKLPAAPATPPVFAAQPLHLLPEEEVHKVDTLLRELRNQAASTPPETAESTPGCEPFSFLLADNAAEEALPSEEAPPSPAFENAAWHSTSPGFLLAEDEQAVSEVGPIPSGALQPPNFASLASALGNIRAPLTTTSKPAATVLPENLPEADARLGQVYKTRPSHVDDLTRIQGLDALTQARLNALGIYRFHQISHWQQSHVAEFGRLLSLQERIGREGWVSQARQLAAL